MRNHVIRATCYGLGLMTLVIAATAADVCGGNDLSAGD